MLRAVYVRTLKPGVTDDDYIRAWLPDGADRDTYPARTFLSHSTTNERQTVVTFEVDAEPDELIDALGALVHPDWRARVAAVAESTELEDISLITAEFGTAAEAPRTVA
jgi:hypothetical protein